MGQVLHGSATTTGVNTAVTTYSYDDFCRLTRSAVTGGAEVNTDYVQDGQPSQQRIVTRIPLPTGEMQSSVWYDGLGRTWKTVAVGDSETDSTITQTEYDARGNAWKVSLPFSPATSPLWITNNYDWNNRLIKTTQAAWTTDCWRYAGLSYAGATIQGMVVYRGRR